MTTPSLEAKTQGTADLCMSTAQLAQHLLHVSDDGPVCSVSTTFTDMLNASGENGPSAISMLGTKAHKVLEEDFIANHQVQFPETPLLFQHLDYFEKIEKLQFYLDTVSKIVKPGCSEEVLKVVLNSMSSVVGMLSMMSSTPFPHSSL